MFIFLIAVTINIFLVSSVKAAKVPDQTPDLLVKDYYQYQPKGDWTPRVGYDEDPYWKFVETQLVGPSEMDDNEQNRTYYKQYSVLPPCAYRSSIKSETYNQYLHSDDNGTTWYYYDTASGHQMVTTWASSEWKTGRRLSDMYFGPYYPPNPKCSQSIPDGGVIIHSYFIDNAVFKDKSDDNITLNIKCNPSDGGVVAGTGRNLQSGSTITLTLKKGLDGKATFKNIEATANSGRKFNGWSFDTGGLASGTSFNLNNNSGQDLTLENDATLVANFICGSDSGGESDNVTLTVQSSDSSLGNITVNNEKNNEQKPFWKYQVTLPKINGKATFNGIRAIAKGDNLKGTPVWGLTYGGPLDDGFDIKDDGSQPLTISKDTTITAFFKQNTKSNILIRAVFIDPDKVDKYIENNNDWATYKPVNGKVGELNDDGQLLGSFTNAISRDGTPSAMFPQVKVYGYDILHVSAIPTSLASNYDGNTKTGVGYDIDWQNKSGGILKVPMMANNMWLSVVLGGGRSSDIDVRFIEGSINGNQLLHSDEKETGGVAKNYNVRSDFNYNGSTTIDKILQDYNVKQLVVQDDSGNTLTQTDISSLPSTIKYTGSEGRYNFIVQPKNPTVNKLRISFVDTNGTQLHDDQTVSIDAKSASTKTEDLDYIPDETMNCTGTKANFNIKDGSNLYMLLDDTSKPTKVYFNPSLYNLTSGEYEYHYTIVYGKAAGIGTIYYLVKSGNGTYDVPVNGVSYSTSGSSFLSQHFKIGDTLKFQDNAYGGYKLKNLTLYGTESYGLTVDKATITTTEPDTVKIDSTSFNKFNNLYIMAEFVEDTSNPTIYYATDGNGVFDYRINSNSDPATGTNFKSQEYKIGDTVSYKITANTGYELYSVKVWGGKSTNYGNTEDTATEIKASDNIGLDTFQGIPMDRNTSFSYRGVHYRAIFKRTGQPIPSPSSGGAIKFDPNETSWTNMGKTGEGSGSYPVRVYYDGTDPVQLQGSVSIHHHEVIPGSAGKDGKSSPPTIIDYSYTAPFTVTYKLQSITVSGDASSVINGNSGYTAITKEGGKLKLHGIGTWAAPVYVLPSPGANESYSGSPIIPVAPTAPVGDSGEYNLDWTRPDISIDSPSSLWVNNPNPYPVNVVITENLSGFDNNSTVTVMDSSHYGRNASDTLTKGGMNYNKTIELQDGIYTITINTGDIATNTHNIVSKTYYVDQTQSDANFSIGSGIFSTDRGSIREEDRYYGILTLEDNLSGVYKAQYSWTFSDLDYGDYIDLTAAGGDHYSCLGGASNMYQYTYFDRYLERPQFKIEKPVGDNVYLHVKIWDTAGNYTYKVFGPFEDPIKLKNFQVTDVRDPGWDKVFWKDSNFTVTTGVTYPASKLPIDGTSNPIYKNALVKPGYAFYFDMTSEYLYRDYDNISIKPTFYYYDNGVYTPVDMYYQLDNYPFVPLGSPLDKVSINLSTVNGNVYIGGLSKLTLTKGVRAFDGKPYYNPNGWQGQIQYSDGKTQWWYGKYFIPSTSIFVKKGDAPRPENILKNNFILVNFQIVANKNGVETTSSNQVFTYVPNQWTAEGGPKSNLYHPGDVLLYDNRFTGQGALSDSKTYIIQ